MASSPFSAKLRDEMQQMQVRRHAFVMRKLSFCISLLGISAIAPSVDAHMVDTATLLYLVPVVAIAFDLYIVSEDHGVKCAAAFLRLPLSGASEQETQWEHFVQQHRRKFSPFSNFVVSLIMLLGSTLLLMQRGHYNGIALTIWATTVLAMQVGILATNLRFRGSFK